MTVRVLPPQTAIEAVTQILDDVDRENIVATNAALAKYIVQSLCAHEWHVDDSGMEFKSNPPRLARLCLICEKTDTISVTDHRRATTDCQDAEFDCDTRCRWPECL